MKTNIFSFLILLLFLSSGAVHARNAGLHVIETHIRLAGDSVHVRLVLHASGLPSNYRMDLTPVICKGAQAALLPAARICGSRNLRSQERKELFGQTSGGNVPLTAMSSDTLFYEASLPYEPWMSHASLRIDNLLSGCCSSILLAPALAAADLALVLPEEPQAEEPVVLPEPVIVLSPTERLAQTEGFIRPATRYEADRQAAGYFRDPDALRVFFRQGRTVIDTTYLDNASTLTRLDRALRVMQADSAVRITRLVVVGYASIEGALQRNTYLAGERADRLMEFAVKRGLSARDIETVNMSEGWDELRDMVENSAGVPGRDEILRIIDTVPVLKGREKQLMNLRGGIPYRWMLKHFFPRQRNAGYVKIYFEKN